MIAQTLLPGIAKPYGQDLFRDLSSTRLMQSAHHHRNIMQIGNG